jgi:hypothetical protein
MRCGIRRAASVASAWKSPGIRRWWIAVEDGGAAEGPRVIDDPTGEHGRGLLLVKGLSVHMGVCGDHRGRLVWAEVPWDEVVAAGPTPPEARYEAAIHDGEAALARRFAGVPAWFGRSTLAWWALVGGDELVSAPSAVELAALLFRLLHAPDQARSMAPAQPRRALGEMPTAHNWRPDIGGQKGGRWRHSGPARVGLGGQRHRDPAGARRAAVTPGVKAPTAVPQACA